MARNLEELKARVELLKHTSFPNPYGTGTELPSQHEQELCSVIAELIGHLEFLPDHAHYLPHNQVYTDGPEDRR